ncbi:hypothetical protein A3Q56_08773, partial [Intoshia linei]
MTDKNDFLKLQKIKFLTDQIFQLKNLLDYFLLTTNNIMEIIVNFEMNAYIRIIFIPGSLRGSRTHFVDLWKSDGCGIDAIRTMMSYNRFLFLSGCIRFDDMHTREQRKKNDRLAPIR